MTAPEFYDLDDELTTARKRAKWDADAAAIANAQERIAKLEAALTTIRDTLPLQNDEYARHVFRVAANALEPEGDAAKGSPTER